MTNTKHPSICCVIVTYNASKWIEKCLNCILNSNIKATILIIDNCSNDNTLEIIRTKFDNIKLILQQKNLGFGAANNIGINYAISKNFEYVLLVNQDLYLEKDAIEKMLIFADKKTILSPIHLNGTGLSLDMNYKLNTLIPHSSEIFESTLCKKNDNQKFCIEVSFVNAACWLIPNNIFSLIGGFNPLFFHYGEDVNYLHRINYHKFKIKIILNSFVYHDRVEFGNKKLFNTKIYLRELLVYGTNINNKFHSIIAFNSLFIFKILLNFFLLKFAKSFNQSYSFIIYLGLIGKIHKSRQIERRLGKNWL